MKPVALGADHAGFLLKEEVKAFLVARGLEVMDLGTHGEERVDYPDYAAAVAATVASGVADRGVLLCGTGIGMAMAANKVAGVRAAACTDPHLARMSREHNDANVLTLGARVTPCPVALEIVAVWLATAFAGGRHTERVDKLARIERGLLPADTADVLHGATR